MTRQLDRNFFTDIQGKFASLAGERGAPDFQGRYVAHIIEAVARQRPGLLSVLSSQATHQSKCLAEYVFAPDSRADLALFNENSDSPFALVEIKASDLHNREHNEKQLRRYLNWAVSGPKKHVIYLSQYPLPGYMREIIAASRKRLIEVPLGSVATRLQSRRDLSDSDLVQSLLEYLYFEGFALTPLDRDDIAALHTFLAFSFLPHLSGHRRVTSRERVADGPKSFATLVQNWQLVSASRVDMLRQHCKSDMPRPVVKYVASPLYARSVDLSVQDFKTYGSKEGGTWWIYTRSNVGKGVGAQLVHEYGIELTVSKRERDEESPPIVARVYSEFYHQKRYFGYASRSIGAGAARDPYKALADGLGDAQRLNAKLEGAVGSSFERACRDEDTVVRGLLKKHRRKIIAA